MFKKIFAFVLKGTLFLLGVLIVAFLILKLVYNDDLPQGQSGEVADELSYKILDAIQYDNFKNASEIHWTFRGVNRYEWQLQDNIVDIYWDNYRVTYHTKEKDESLAYLNEGIINGNDKEEAIAYAIKNFNNDSFWVVAPFKLFDNGTTRSLIKDEGKDKLLVQYTSGGSTPGDAFLWEVDDNYIPVAFKMWVSIIPFDGVEAKWSEWEMTDGGFPLPESRSVWGLEIPISGVKVII